VKGAVIGRYRANQTILSNAGSLVGTWGITSALGALYWLVAARTFSPAAVGLASAAVSAMTLLGALATLGLNTLLMGELPQRPKQARPLISASLVVTALAGGLLGLAFSLIAPHLSSELAPLGSTAGHVALFAFAVSATAVGMVLDQALIGLLRGSLQLWRNLVFGIIKLGAVFLLGVFVTDELGMQIVATWVLGLVLSFAVLAVTAVRRAPRLRAFIPRFRLLRGLRTSAVEHHIFNLALRAPSMALPVLVTAMLSAELNASFYVASMIAGFIYVVPGSLSTVLYAVGAGKPRELADKARLTLQISFGTTAAACLVLFVAAEPILSIFGPSYAANAGWALRILAFASFPLVVKTHYATIRRIHQRVGRTVPLVLAGTALEFALAAAGGQIDGLNGLSLGWTIALCVEAVVMAPVVWRALEGTPLWSTGPASAPPPDAPPAPPLEDEQLSSALRR
jgi:O-antigen/teichoic acid export membrane protein